MRIITIVDENDVIIDSFKVCDNDAKKLIDNYSTNWMDDVELKEYLES